METSILLGIGTGRSGTLSLSRLLNAQPGHSVTHENTPLLPWSSSDPAEALRKRFARWRRRRSTPVVGDVASFYLPYLEAAFELEPGLKVICIQRDREEVVESFCRWVDRVEPLPTNHWSANPAPGFYHDPVWSQIFPKYDDPDRETCLRRYCDEYRDRVEALAKRHPGRIRVFPMDDLNTEEGVRRILDFAGIPRDSQKPLIGSHANKTEQAKSRRRPEMPPDDPRRCVVLVPYQSHIVPQCEDSLKVLEKRGYTVRRVRGYAAIDQGRSQMASDALWQGFEETMWIDSDVGFQADDVDRLRKHRVPIVCGIYPKKGQRSLAAHVMPGTKELVFGAGGGLTELRYAATGFLLVRRPVYEQMQMQLRLPLCNERFSKPVVPFFLPMAIDDDDGAWYLGEDYSFCERARQCGFPVLADTAIRLWHVGNYAFGWEDAGLNKSRFDTFRYAINESDAPT